LHFSSTSRFFCRRLVANLDPEDFSSRAYKAGEHVGTRTFSALPSPSAAAALEFSTGIVGDGSEGLSDMQSMETFAKAVVAAGGSSSDAAEDDAGVDAGMDDDASAAAGPADAAVVASSVEDTGVFLRDFSSRAGETGAVTAAVPTQGVTAPAPLPPAGLTAISSAATSHEVAAEVSDNEEDNEEREAVSVATPSSRLVGTRPSAAAHATATESLLIPFAHVHGERDVLSLPAKLILPDSVLQVRLFEAALFFLPLSCISALCHTCRVPLSLQRFICFSSHIQSTLMTAVPSTALIINGFTSPRFTVMERCLIPPQRRCMHLFLVLPVVMIPLAMLRWLIFISTDNDELLWLLRRRR
jgi:hypothetical protein